MNPYMKRRSEGNPDQGEASGALRDKLMGLGERSMRKSYYPELRKRMDELERFRMLLDIASDLVFVVEVETGRITDVNATAWRKIGVAHEGLLGMRFQDLLPDDQAPAVLDLLSTGVPVTEGFVFSLPLAGGGRFPAELTMNVLGMERLSLAVVVARDVSSRMEAQRELSRAWGYLRSIVDAMPSLLVGVNDRLEITLINAQAADAIGMSAVSAHGKPLADILPWLPELPKALLSTIKDNTPRVLRKMPGKGPAGAIWYDATIFPLGQGRAEAVARIDDVSARVRMDEVLVQTEKMLSVGALAAGMAHEINNPLAGILQGVQSVIRRLSPDLEANRTAAARTGLDMDVLAAYLADRDLIPMLRSIQESGVRAAKIVTNILEFSRRSDMSKAQVPLPQMVDKALELAVSEFDLKKKYDFRHIRITREDDPSLPSVWCVPTQIEQVILNLLKNAAQALSASATQNPAITIRTGWGEGMACVEVQDNGPGMDDSTRERLFEPFFTTKGPGEGTGLGLSVVYYIVVEQHEGRISVRSTPGSGTTVSVKLPVKGPETKGPQT